MMIAVVFTGCKSPGKVEGGGGGGSDDPCTDVHIGVVAFTDTLYVGEVHLIDEHWQDGFNTFSTTASNPSQPDQTWLYYSEYLGLQDMLSMEYEPENLTNVTIITITQSLDNYSVNHSWTNPENYASNEAYRNGLHNTIMTQTVFDKPINAYSIGIVNSGVSSQMEEFRANLSACASDDNNIFLIHTADSVSVILDNLAEDIKQATGNRNSCIVMLVYDCTQMLRKTPAENLSSFAQDLTCGHVPHYTAPVVVTHPVSDVTSTTFTCGGDLLDWGHNWVTTKGLVYGKTPNLDIYNWITTSFSHYATGPGNFPNITIRNLKPDTDYYVAAYAKNFVGVSYGEVRQVHTLGPVVTHPATNIGETYATLNGEIIEFDNMVVLEKGICIGINPLPTIENAHMVCTEPGNIISCLAEGLMEETIYHFRAYARLQLSDEVRLYYGQDLEFKTLGHGGIQFSVSPTKKVAFSPGNLQYNKGNGTWRFAEHQWDVVGENNESVSYEWYTGWLDVFGWGTADDPTCTVDSCDYYGYSVFAEWGNNPISNGAGSRWYTLTSDEWDYVVFGRAAANRPSFVMANVHDINGIVLLPDGWDINYSFERLNEEFFQGMPEYISDSVWSDILEMNGAVFLPAAGIRTHLWWKDDEGNYTEPHHDYDMMNEMALYWSKTPAPTEWRDSTIQVRAYAMQMWYIPGLGATMAVDAGLRCDAVSVRLVKDILNY